MAIVRQPRAVGKRPIGGVGPAVETADLGFEEWSENSLPSLLVIGASGTGKTDSARKLAMAGFRIGVVPIEPKIFGLQGLEPRPLRINLCKPVGNRPPTMIERYDRLMKHLDGLRAGKFRTAPDGSKIDLLFYDGLTEAGDVIHAKRKGAGKADLDAWMHTGNDTIDLFRDLRDAAGVAATDLGLPPIGIVATCGEASPKRVDIKGKTSYVDKDQPVLPGNMALVKLPFVFEVIWRTSGGMDHTGAHEYRVHTQVGDTWIAKSPGGLYDPIVTGPGGIDEQGIPRSPDIGAMYWALLTNERSPYFNAEYVTRREESQNV